LWNMKSGEQDGDSLAGNGAAMWALVLSPDGKTLASGDRDGNILLWDLAGRDLRPPYPVVQPNITSLAYSPDGSLLASGSRDNTVILWDVATGQPRGLPLTAHTDWVLDLSFNPAGNILASGSRDSTIVLWDVPTGQPIGQPLQSLNGWVWSVAFSPDGVTLASGSREGQIDLWTVSLAEWQRLACLIANRDLTETERDRYLFGGQASADCLSPES
jgi:WD40 repeat protein